MNSDKVRCKEVLDNRAESGRGVVDDNECNSRVIHCIPYTSWP